MKGFKNLLKYFKIPSPPSSSSIKPFTPNNSINVHQNKKTNDGGYKLPKNYFYNNVASPIQQKTTDFGKLINKKIAQKDFGFNYHESAIWLFYYWLRDEIIVKNIEKMLYKSKVATLSIFKAFLAKNPYAIKLKNLLQNYDIRLKSERREKVLIFFMVGTFLVLLLI